MSDWADDGVLDLMIQSMSVEADGVLAIDLVDPDGGLLPAWAPGAHIDLTFDGLTRQYSLCGDPADPDRYRIAVLRETDSRGGSSYLHEIARPGDILEIGGPRNHFELTPAKRYLFIAGGIGITPILPMIRQAVQDQIPWQLIYGGRSQRSMAFTTDLVGYGAHVQLYPQDATGTPDINAIIRTRAEDTAVYCCGPAGLIDAVQTSIDCWTPGELNIERFVAKDFSAAESRPLTVHCRRSGVELTVSKSQTVLDALEAAGIGVPNACRDGVCGSCEVAVLEGVPEHRDSYRSSDDDTSSIAVCVSRASSAELVLDI